MSRKKIVIITILMLSVVFIMACSNQETVPSENQGSSHASFWEASTSKELIEQADIIGYGRVIDSYTTLVHDLVATCNVVEFDNIYMLSNKLTEKIFNKSTFADGSQRIELRQTGGVYEEYKTQPISNVPLLEVGKTYVLFLRHLHYDDFDFELDYDFNHYLIIGGYQGVAEVENDEIRFAQREGSEHYDFSDLNVRVEDLADRLQEFKLDKKRYIINTEKKQSKEFISDAVKRIR